MIRGVPLFALGFRPFFLFGSVFGALAIIFWAFSQLNFVTLPSYFDSKSWHAHEMLFGFTAAILAGFLLTASKNWANTRGVQGRSLILLFGVWLSGRFAIQLSSFLPKELIAFIDLSFLPLVSFFFVQTLSKGAKKNNYIFLLWLMVLFLGNGLMHLEALGLTTDTSRSGYILGVDTMVVIMSLISGRVIPMFTQNAIPGMNIVKRPKVERIVVISLVLYLLTDFFAEGSSWMGGISIVAGLMSFVRLLGWQSLKTRGRPILWVLHLGYAFLSLGLLFRGLSLFVFPVPSSIPIHLLTAGAMGLLILGMISRVSLGHTARPLTVSKSIVTAYGLVALASLLRVFGPFFLPKFYLTEIVVSAFLWGLGFILFFVVYWPILTRPRLDGLEG